MRLPGYLDSLSCILKSMRIRLEPILATRSGIHQLYRDSKNKLLVLCCLLCPICEILNSINYCFIWLIPSVYQINYIIYNRPIWQPWFRAIHIKDASRIRERKKPLVHVRNRIFIKARKQPGEIKRRLQSWNTD